MISSNGPADNTNLCIHALAFGSFISVPFHLSYRRKRVDTRL